RAGSGPEAIGRVACVEAFRRGGRPPSPGQAAGPLRKLPGWLGSDAALRELRRDDRYLGSQWLAAFLLGRRAGCQSDAARRWAARRELADAFHRRPWRWSFRWRVARAEL